MSDFQRRITTTLLLVVLLATPGWAGAISVTSLLGHVVDAASDVTSDISHRSATEPVDFTKPGAVQIGFSPGNSENLVVATIRGAKVSIIVAAYSFTSKPIAKALVAAHKKGIKVYVVMDKSQKTAKYSSATFLANSGVPVRIDSEYAIMHNKFMVIDAKTVETGSFNYTASAHKRNAENVVVINDLPKIAAVYGKEWRRLWDESKPYSARH